MYLAIVLLNGSLQDTVLILALVQRSDIELATKEQDFWPSLPQAPSGLVHGLPVAPRGHVTTRPGASGVVVRCVGNGILPTHKFPNFILASVFWLFQLYLEYLVPVGLVNTVPVAERQLFISAYAASKLNSRGCHGGNT